MFQEYVSIVIATISNTRIFIVQSLSNKIWRDFINSQRLILAVFVFIVFLILLGKTHSFLQKKTNSSLEKYTLIYDKILFEIQKNSYDLSEDHKDSLDLNFIKKIIESGSYLNNHQFLLDNIHDNAMIIELRKQLNKYNKINQLQKIVWRLLVIFSIWLYKIVW